MKSLTVELRERAESYRQGGPSSEHTALLLEAAASKIEYLLSLLEMEREQAEMFKSQAGPYAPPQPIKGITQDEQ